MMEPSQDDFDRVLAPVEHLRRRHHELSERGPSPGSAAHRDGKNKLGKIAWDRALPASSIGVDHLAAWRVLRLTAGYQPIFAHFTLLRGAIEGAAVARWICDPAIGVSERIRRAAGVQRVDLQERAKFERGVGSSLPKPIGGGRTAEQRVEDLDKLLKAHKVVVITMPTATALFALYVSAGEREQAFSGEAVFRLISGVIHAKVWSLYGISRRGELVTLDNERRAVRISADERLAFVLTSLAMRVATGALEDLERYGASNVAEM